MQRADGSYQIADVALTGSLVTYATASVPAGVGFAYELTAFLTITTTGNLATRVNVDNGTVAVRQLQTLNSNASTSIALAASGTGAQTVTQAVAATGTRAVVVKGTVLSTAAGNLNVDISYSGTATLQAGTSLVLLRLR